MKGKEIVVCMSHAAYKQMLKLDGIKDRHDLIVYINQTWGLLGNVVDIQFDD